MSGPRHRLETTERRPYQSKRDFDARTQVDNPELDFKASYRTADRLVDKSRAPLLERRWAYLQRTGKSPLALGSPLRAPAIYTARKRRTND